VRMTAGRPKFIAEAFAGIGSSTLIADSATGCQRRNAARLIPGPNGLANAGQK